MASVLGPAVGAHCAAHSKRAALHGQVDWLELNCRATKLIFRDKRRQLHLYLPV
jgi:hypothetical protein